MVLVFAENTAGKFKKPALEAVTYGYKTAQAMGLDCAALVLGPCSEAASLGKYGATKVVHMAEGISADFDSQVYAKAIAQAAKDLGAQVVVLTNSPDGKALVGRLAIKLEAGSVSGATSVPDTSNGFVVKKNVFSGKAIASVSINTPVKVVSVMGNALPPEEVGSEASVETWSTELPSPATAVAEVQRIEGTVPLPEAELVVSGGRGLKGPENWNLVLDLAEVLGATTACSRPVADADWRPHHEHVGQTGVAIRPNLYIAIGISGAIQHLAGVNRSKVIVVINKDPEAPFFKAADYGVVGDAFEVVPRLTEALKNAG